MLLLLLLKWRVIIRLLCAGGKLYTVFSAPDYPQFQADEDERYNNVASVAVLSTPNYDEPRFVQYSAVLPRPAVSTTLLSHTHSPTQVACAAV